MGSIARLSADGNDIYAVGDATLFRVRWDGRALALDTSALLEAYRARDALRGHEVSWSGGRGTAAGIDGAGRLVVELAGGGRTALSAGEVHLLR